MKLSDSNMVATIAVHDTEKAKEFYGKTLGLAQTNQNPAGVEFDSGGAKLFVYQSNTAGSGKATCVTWTVTNIEQVVKTLSNSGVKFMIYDIPNATWEGDVAVMGNMKAAWFSDPDGNILGLSQM